jgi:predicted nucleic acid-binding protein
MYILDTNVVSELRKVRTGKRNEHDALIAATALVHGMTVVTRNVADFQPTGVTILNPWQPARAGWICP